MSEKITRDKLISKLVDHVADWDRDQLVFFVQEQREFDLRNMSNDELVAEAEDCNLDEVEIEEEKS